MPTKAGPGISPGLLFDRSERRQDGYRAHEVILDER